MKILVLSDSHGNISNMVRAVHAESPRMIFHLGDCLRDAERLSAQIPDIPLCKVPGNCDYCFTEPAEQILCLEDKRILLCHGHTYGVKHSMMSAGYAAMEKEADIFLFGHTHRAVCEQLEDGLWMMNPGSSRSTYGIIEIGPDHLSCSIHRQE